MIQLIRYAVVAALAASGPAQAADLTVDVGGLKNAQGKVLVAVYSRSEDFLKAPVRTAAVASQSGKVRLAIADLPSGDYAVSVFQDQNGNGELDVNLVGMPVEPYGFSNDAAGNFGPPSFQQSLVHLSEAGQIVHINLR